MIRNYLFHRVHTQRDQLWDPMDPVQFERCIKFITKRHPVALLEDLVANGPISPKDNYATIMFDDGYKDNLDYAAPILAKYKVKASIYVVTDCINRNVLTWTHKLDYNFQHTDKSSIDLRFDFLPEHLRIDSLPTREARIEYVRQLKPVLKRVTHEQRIMVMDIVSQAFDDVQDPGLMMNWNELAQLKAAGFYIGSHTDTHIMMATTNDEALIRRELEIPAACIKEKLGHFPVTISYPVGSYNETTMRLSKEAGYTIGLALKQERFYPERDGLFEVPRMELYNEKWFKTKLRLRNLIERAKKLAGRK